MKKIMGNTQKEQHQQQQQQKKNTNARATHTPNNIISKLVYLWYTGDMLWIILYARDYDKRWLRDEIHAATDATSCKRADDKKKERKKDKTTSNNIDALLYMILVDGDVTVTVPVLCSDDFFSIPFIHLVHNFLATLRTHAMHVAETEYPPGQIQRHSISTDGFDE